MITPITIDFETYYTDKANGEYSLTWMTAEEYIRDPRFEMIGFSLKFGDGPSEWFSGDAQYLLRVLHEVDWSKAMAIGHNMSEFDSLIMTERCGLRPRAFACTLQMARALHAGKQAKSLAELCKLYGLQAKGDEVVRAVNKRRLDFSPRELQEYGIYCGNTKNFPHRKGDVDLTWELFRIMAPQLPQQELRLASLSTRMFAEPRLELDNQLLVALGEDLRAKKQTLLEKVADILSVPPGDIAARVAQAQTLLRKDAVLAGVLRDQYDVEPPIKLSPKRKDENGNPLVVYAFAKTDEGMTELLNFEDESDPQGAEDIQALAAGRIGVKSTLAESRVARFTGISQRGRLPVPLAYGKTHTHRLAGSQKLNLQNLSGTKRLNLKTPENTLIVTPAGIDRLHKTRAIEVDGKKVQQLMDKSGRVWDFGDCHIAGLRDCIRAPAGKRLVVADSSQIELRVCHLLAGQMDTVAELRAKIDVYSSFASTLYSRPVTKADHKERQHGKVGMLQLQYQSGASSFRNAARIMGGIRLTPDEAQATVDTYRARFTEVRKLWWNCQKAIAKLAAGGSGGYIDQWGLCRIDDGRISMSDNGQPPLVYENLRQGMLEGFNGGEPELQWVYDDKELRRMKKIYGGSITENLCQWLARRVVFEQMLECEARWGATPGNGVVLTVHDEIGLIVDEDDAEDCLEFCLDVMSQPPKWWPELPVAAEGGIGVRYGDAK